MNIYDRIASFMVVSDKCSFMIGHGAKPQTPVISLLMIRFTVSVVRDNLLFPFHTLTYSNIYLANELL